MATADRSAPPRAQLGALGWIALIPAIAVLAHGEWSLAVACGVHPYVAVGVPAALDIYAIRALRAGREVLPVVLVMVAVNGASHLISTGLISVTPGVVIAVSAVPALVMWRVHAIGTRSAGGDTVNATPVDIGPSSLPVVIHVPPSAAAYVPVVPERPTTPPAIEQAPDDTPTAEPEPTTVDVDALRAAPIPTDLGRAERVVAQLYRDLGHQPITSEIADALKKARLSYRGGTPRDVRTRAKAGDATLALYPPHPSRRSIRAAG